MAKSFSGSKVRQATVAERNAFRATLTNEQHIARLDARLGKNQGAKKERKRLTGK